MERPTLQQSMFVVIWKPMMDDRALKCERWREILWKQEVNTRKEVNFHLPLTSQCKEIQGFQHTPEFVTAEFSKPFNSKINMVLPPLQQSWKCSSRISSKHRRIYRHYFCDSPTKFSTVDNDNDSYVQLILVVVGKIIVITSDQMASHHQC